MTHYYVFNGDADGLCALQQLRLASDPPPASSPVLITGVKRDIELLARVPLSANNAASTLTCTVLDISLDKNRAALLQLLQAGASVRYFDHHHTGDVPEHPRFEAHLDLSPTVCTSLLVDRHLQGRQRRWAIVGAFGDNLASEARALARDLGFDAETTRALEELGICLNYNAYGETLADLHVPPAELADQMLATHDPVEFARQSETYRLLAGGYADDMEQARRLSPTRTAPGNLLFVLPDAAWARRASGLLANELVVAHGSQAIAILSPKKADGYLVSVRVPVDAKVTADAFCRRFATGGGRRTAAGINHLPSSDFEGFAKDFARSFAMD